MSVTTLHGRGGMVYFQGSGATATKLGGARKWSINIDRDKDENNKMGDTWRSQLTGFLKYDVNFEGVVDTTETSPMDAATATSTKIFYFYPDLNANSHFYAGTIWPTLKIDVALDATERYTLTGDGDGALVTA